MVLDGTNEADQRAKKMLTWDVANGVHREILRHGDPGRHVAGRAARARVAAAHRCGSGRAHCIAEGLSGRESRGPALGRRRSPGSPDLHRRGVAMDPCRGTGIARARAATGRSSGRGRGSGGHHADSGVRGRRRSRRRRREGPGQGTGQSGARPLGTASGP